MRKTLAQLILLLAFICVAWIALQTVWKSTAPIPEGFVSSFQVGDNVILKGGPNPNRQRYNQDDSKCLDSQPKGSVGKVIFTGVDHVLGDFVAIRCNGSLTSFYLDSDLIKYSEPAPERVPEQAMAPKVAYKATYKANTLVAPTKRAYQCQSGNISGIKRADQCRCLPGYIPYKTDCGTYTCQNTSDSTVTRNCY